MRNYMNKLARKIFSSFKGISVEMEYSGVVEKAARILGYPSVKEAKRSSGRDMLISLPTGYGKSFCYATLPIVFDILLKRDGSKESEISIVIVVSPLLALMGDQVSSFS